jgi:acetyltransferase-like isoleucine patch superfamily enzyme
MSIKYFFQQGLFVVRNRYVSNLLSSIRIMYFSLAGMRIGKYTYLPRIYITWPHQVSIGQFCKLEKGITFKFDGIHSEGPSIIIGDNVFIGSFCEFNINCNIFVGSNVGIASGCRFIDHDHGVKKEILIGLQPSVKAPITISDDVWLGCNVVVLKGVSIGRGAVVAAGSVVTKSIPDYEIWAGVPARCIKERI